MPRTYYEVVPKGREWAVRCQSRLLSLHMDKCSAVAIAAAVAEGEHEATGEPTGVRLQLQDGRWDHQGAFGGEMVALEPLPAGRSAAPASLLEPARGSRAAPRRSSPEVR